eukprot:186301_1
MGDNVKRIEIEAFHFCTALRFIRFSKTLEYIGEFAFCYCSSLKWLFLPSTVKEIWSSAFNSCWSLRSIVLPHGIGLNNVSMGIIRNTDGQVNEWLVHRIDDAPFHKLCYDSSVTTKQVSDYLIENGINSALQIDTVHGMNPLHMLCMNPHASADAILALLKTNINAASIRDHEGKNPLYYALYYNPCAFVRMYSYLRKHINTVENDIQSLSVVNPDDGDTPLIVLAKNPFVPANSIAALLELKMEDAFCPDDGGLSPLDYAKECNFEGLVSMIAVLCNHRNSISSFEGGE